MSDRSHSWDGGFTPGYVKLHRTGELAARADRARELLSSCRLCPRQCHANRAEGESGVCRIGPDAVVSSYGVHLGEETVIVGRRGSGTIFMTGCNLACVFCQNFEISQTRRGQVASSRQIAQMMLELRDQRVHHINLVTPTHQLPALLESLDYAAELGLDLPVIHNNGGYESIEALKLLEGVIDVYMPDVKFGDNEAGLSYAGVPDYWDRCQEAVKEMHRQVGDLDVRTLTYTDGTTAQIAARGLLVRHLVMPNGRAHTRNVVRFLADEISRDTYTNISTQYRPKFEARNFPEINRITSPREVREALAEAKQAGLHRFAEL